MRNVLLTIEYDGSGFHGWQIQPNLRTVQGYLQEVLSFICNEPVKVEGTSRTDAGVHAYGQQATIRGNFKIPSERIPIAANNIMDDVKIISAVDMPEGFHARFSALGKTYLYKIGMQNESYIFRRNYAYILKESLNISNMREGVKCIIGKKDFACFQAMGGNPTETTVRTIFGAEICELPTGEICVEVTGDGFLYNMVRIIVGTLIDVGRGKKAPEEIENIIASKKRDMAGPTAPACGLYLKKVYYNKEDIEKKITCEEFLCQNQK